MVEKVTGIAEKIFEDLGGYWLGRGMSASPEIREIADNYRLNVLKQMRSLYIDDVSTQNPKRKRLGDKLIVSIKRDGMFNILYYDNRSTPDSIFCNSPYGTVRYNLPVNKEFDKRIESLNKTEILLSNINYLLCTSQVSEVFRTSNQIYSMVLAGELFARVKRKGDRPRIFDVMKVSRTPESMEDLERICFDVFDLISVNEVPISSVKYKIRLNLLNSLFPRHSNWENKKTKIRVIKYFTNVKAIEVPKLYDEWVIQHRHEGLVIRTEFGLTFKLKSVNEIDVVIIGVAKSRTKIKGEEVAGSLLVALIRQDGTYQILTSVESGLTNMQKLDFLNLLKNDEVASDYNAKNEVGQPFKFVRPKHVIQIKFIDLITESPLRDDILIHNLKFDNDKWTIKNRVHLIKLINPWFDAFRSQINTAEYPSLHPVNPKEPIYHDVKIDQLFPLLKRLTELGSPKSKKVFKDLLFERIKSGTKSLIYSLAKEGLLNNDYFTQEELQQIIQKIGILDEVEV